MKARRIEVVNICECPAAAAVEVRSIVVHHVELTLRVDDKTDKISLYIKQSCLKTGDVPVVGLSPRI